MAKWIGQAAWFLLFMLGISYLSTSPAYNYLDKQQALLRLSISHAGQIVGTCRARSAAELANMSRNMRALQDCPRERSPVTIEVELDGRILYHEVIPPSGLSHDGASTVYRRFPLQSGEHRLAVRMNDSKKISGFNFERSEVVQLHPAQVLVIDFNQQQGGVIIK
ncbi:MAG TPA: hypothetical protein VJ577_12660 [Burkholderiaceae bacterium]|nr:hypothetical protein [Burkholderiaceae bacterium]